MPSEVTLPKNYGKAIKSPLTSVITMPVKTSSTSPTRCMAIPLMNGANSCTPTSVAVSSVSNPQRPTVVLSENLRIPQDTLKTLLILAKSF